MIATADSQPKQPAIPVARTFDAFFRRECAAVGAYAFALTGHRETAEDIAQEAFVATYRKWDRIEAPAGYVRRAVANLAIGRIRGLTRQRALDRMTTTALIPFAELNTADGDFWRMVSELPPRQRQVTALYYLEDRSVEQIAELLGLAAGSVKSHLSKARASLASSLHLHNNEDIR